MREIKLLLLIPHLGGGGAERVIALLARHLDPTCFEVQIFTTSSDHPGAQPLPRWVVLHRCEHRHVRNAWFRLIQLAWKEKPDVILSGIAHMNHLVLLVKPFLPSNTRIIVRQDTTASHPKLSRLSKLLCRSLYPRAHAILCQSPPMATDLADNFHISREKLVVLANPIDLDADHSHVPPPPTEYAWRVCPVDAPRLLTVGRLSHEKGLDLLLHAIAQLKSLHPHLQLILLGTGPAHDSLVELTAQLSLQNQVTFAGFQPTPASWYPSATLFVLPSRREGMPNALLEAAAAGLPLLATACSQGLTNLLSHAPGTWLTTAVTADALAATLTTALATLRTGPARYQHQFLAPFELKTAILAYHGLIQSIVAAGKPAQP